MTTIDTILFATDFSEISDHAFEYAASLASVYDSRLVIVHVVMHQTDLREFYVPHQNFDDLDRYVEEGAQRKMAEFRKAWEVRFPNVVTHVVTGIPYEEILKKAAEESASLIVMGTHGRQGFQHFLFGSTAERVVKLSTCPVMTVRSPHAPEVE